MPSEIIGIYLPKTSSREREKKRDRRKSERKKDLEIHVVPLRTEVVLDNRRPPIAL